MSDHRMDFEALYRQHHGFVWRSLRRLGASPAEADDLTQDVFVVAHRRLPSFEGRSKITTWLFGIALRVHRDARRKQEAGRRREADASVPRPPTTPDRRLSRHQAADVLDTLLSALDENKRTVFVMSEILQLGAPEIAATLEIKLNTVYSRLRAARQLFEAELQAYRETHSGGLPWMS